MGRLSHILHFIGVARILARHDALFPLEMLPVLHPLVSFARFLAGLSRVSKKPKKTRKGERLRNAIEELGPAYIKLGQTLATRPDLVGHDLAASLSQLQDNLKPFSSQHAKQEIRKGLGLDIDALFGEFNDEPVAAASIAQVHYAKSKDGTKVAVKILRPGIEKRIARNIEAFYWLAHQIEARSPEARRLRLYEAIKTYDQSVRIELDLRLEAAAATELAANMADMEGYRVPAIHWELTSKRILTMERVEAVPISDIDALKALKLDMEVLAERVMTFFLTQAMGHGFFHADLHPGNIFVDKKGTIIPVDFGIMGRLDQTSRRFMSEILLGFHTGDFDRVSDLHFEAGYIPAHQSRALFSQALRSLIEPIKGKPLQQISFANILSQLFETTRLFSMSTQPHLLMLQRTMVMAEGLALSLNPSINLWETTRPTLEHWAQHYLSAETQLKDLAGTLQRIAHKLPRLLDYLEEKLEDDPSPGLSSGPSGDALEAKNRRTLYFLLGLIAGAFLVWALF